MFFVFLKMFAAVGLWAAVWMLPRDLRYGTWASSGEIDFYEMKNEFLQNNMALHYGGPYPAENKRYNVYKPRPGGGAFYDDFVPVAVEWSPTRIAMSIDGREQMSMRSKSVDSKGYYSVARDATANAPFDIPFYLIVNLAVGESMPVDSVLQHTSAGMPSIHILVVPIQCQITTSFSHSVCRWKIPW
jgi:beta-glucanase (GH16 family)